MKWISEPKDTESPVGKPIYIPCLADGLPKPTIEWTKLEGDESKVVGSELRVGSTSVGDAGYYECRAKNGVDEQLVTRIRLDVLGKYLGLQKGSVRFLVSHQLSNKEFRRKIKSSLLFNHLFERILLD